MSPINSMLAPIMAPMAPINLRLAPIVAPMERCGTITGTISGTISGTMKYYIEMVYILSEHSLKENESPNENYNGN